MARGHGIATRVRGLLLDGRFWYPRFPRLRALIPRHVVLAWPEFLWDGSTCSSCDLSGHVVADLGCFDSRDDLFDRHGQTLCLPVRVPADLIMSRRAA
ncbi:hypothetical protein [Nonomuraea sp. NPDC003214]